MNNLPPLSEALFDGATPPLSRGWSNWFTGVFLGLMWKKSFNATTTLDFGSIATQSQATLTTTVTGARSGDAVQVTPANDVSGIIFIGVVTADNTVSVYAKNFSTGSVNPPSQVYRIIVLQN